MIRASALLLAAAIAFVALLVFASPATPAQGAAAPVGCGDLFAQQPLVIFQTNGNTLAGPTHFQLSVFGDGTIAISKKSWDGTSKADSTVIAPGRAAEFHKAIVSLGGLTLCDSPQMISDVPLNTITVFNHDTTDARAHTFSFLGGNSGPYSQIESFVSALAAAVFPNF
jgi:hypothetical protein